MKFFVSLLIVVSFFSNANFNLELPGKKTSQNEEHKYVIKLSKKELDSNVAYFLSNDLFKGKRFTIEGFKIKFTGRPSVESKKIAFSNNIKYILKRQEVGSKALIYDIENYVLENEKEVVKPNGNVQLEIVFTE